jgi:hypothetical protein
MRSPGARLVVYNAPCNFPSRRTGFGRGDPLCLREFARHNEPTTITEHAVGTSRLSVRTMSGFAGRARRTEPWPTAGQPGRSDGTSPILRNASGSIWPTLER